MLSPVACVLFPYPKCMLQYPIKVKMTCGGVNGMQDVRTIVTSASLCQKALRAYMKNTNVLV